MVCVMFLSIAFAHDYKSTQAENEYREKYSRNKKVQRTHDSCFIDTISEQSNIIELVKDILNTK